SHPNVTIPLPSDFGGVTSKACETITSKDSLDTTTSETSKDSLEKPKSVRSSAPIIEEWESDSDDDCVIRPSSDTHTNTLFHIPAPSPDPARFRPTPAATS
ncbi:hypothetical protein Tco_0054790, partial [Tanacetum coccineum]